VSYRSWILLRQTAHNSTACKRNSRATIAAAEEAVLGCEFNEPPRSLLVRGPTPSLNVNGAPDPNGDDAWFQEGTFIPALPFNWAGVA
jgi:hypothetical protein